MTRLGEDRITEIFGTPEEMHESIERGWKDVHYLFENIDEWRAKYLDNWVAVYDEAIIAVEPDLDKIIAVVRSLPVPRGEVLLWPIRATYSNIVPSVFGVTKE